MLPVVTPVFQSAIPADDLAMTWLGHATVVVQMDNVIFITDPMFSDRASPSQMVGPKRYRDPACSVHDLPSKLDAVLISHNHYDHLDMNSVTLLNARFGVDLRWFVPQGLLSWFEAAGCENVVELDWWEENCVPEKGDVSFTFVPSQHWSKRTLNDDNKSLWGGWVVCGPNHRFYFAGDTGYCPVFKQIGRMFGPFSASAIPIGAFEPRWFMKNQHVNPEEAVQIHEDVRSRFTLGVHWGTFALANEVGTHSSFVWHRLPFSKPNSLPCAIFFNAVLLGSSCQTEGGTGRKVTVSRFLHHLQTRRDTARPYKWHHVSCQKSSAQAPLAADQ